MSLGQRCHDMSFFPLPFHSSSTGMPYRLDVSTTAALFLIGCLYLDLFPFFQHLNRIHGWDNTIVIHRVSLLTAVL